MKVLDFHEDHFENIILGKKQITMRKYRQGSHDFEKGEVVVGRFKTMDGELRLLLEITQNTKMTAMSQVTRAEARADGFENQTEALEGLQEYYKDLDWSSTVVVIHFRIARINKMCQSCKQRRMRPDEKRTLPY